jgi:hypothetical protein
LLQLRYDEMCRAAQQQAREVEEVREVFRAAMPSTQATPKAAGTRRLCFRVCYVSLFTLAFINCRHTATGLATPRSSAAVTEAVAAAAALRAEAEAARNERDTATARGTPFISLHLLL